MADRCDPKRHGARRRSPDTIGAERQGGETMRRTLVVRADRYRSLIPPLRAARARRMSPSRMPEWSLSWAHRFAEGLASNPLGPLHTGRWLLRSPESYEFGCHRPVREYPHAYLNWFDGWGGTLPLRRLPDADSARVKAYRRKVREGVLPPVLLWYASGLDGYHRTILDGLARTKGRDHPAYRAFAERARQQIADLCVSEPRRFAPTRAWPLPGVGTDRRRHSGVSTAVDPSPAPTARRARPPASAGRVRFACPAPVRVAATTSRPARRSRAP